MQDRLSSCSAVIVAPLVLPCLLCLSIAQIDEYPQNTLAHGAGNLQRRPVAPRVLPAYSVCCLQSQIEAYVSVILGRVAQAVASQCRPVAPRSPPASADSWLDRLISPSAIRSCSARHLYSTFLLHIIAAGDRLTMPHRLSSCNADSCTSSASCLLFLLNA